LRDDRRLNALARGRLRAQRAAAPRLVDQERAPQPAGRPAVTPPGPAEPLALVPFVVLPRVPQAR
jgi:hypothetical protein